MAAPVIKSAAGFHLKQTNPEESNSRVTQKRMLEQIVAIPATLYLPTSIVAELNEICGTLGYTPEQLVIQALRGQIDYWNEHRMVIQLLGRRRGDRRRRLVENGFLMALSLAICGVASFSGTLI